MARDMPAARADAESNEAVYATGGPAPAAATDSAFERLARLPATPAAALAPAGAAAVAVLYGFDLAERPLLRGLAELPGELVPARSTVELASAQVGCDVVVLFEAADPRRPIIVGVIGGAAASAQTAHPALPVRVDGERLVLTAEREIVLECGDASITLTRAGRVVIRGRDVLSVSSGYQRIKGAAVDIN